MRRCDTSEGSDEHNSAADDQASSASPTPTTSTSPETPATLAETCPDVAGALRALNRAVVITQDQALALRTELQELTDAGDDEVRNALALLLGPTETFAAGGVEPGLEYIDAEAAFDGALLSLDDRCRAVGSPVLG